MRGEGGGEPLEEVLGGFVPSMAFAASLRVGCFLVVGTVGVAGFGFKEDF